MNSSDLIPVGTVDELAPGQRKLAFINGRGVVLFNIDGTIHAIDDSCPHQGASVANGHLNGKLFVSLEDAAASPAQASACNAAP
jgi:3-phenylpropionate/trans-cinnamate dioxygenase ferredoxin subunit